MTKAPANERTLLLLLSAIQFTHILDFVIMMPLGPQFIREFSIPAEQFSWLISAYTFAAAIAGFLLAFHADRFDRKKLLLILYGIFTAATFGCGMSPNFTTFLIFRIVAGASGGILNGLLLATIGDEIPEARRGQATGVVMSSFSIASIVGIPLALLLANLLDFRAPFIALGFVSSGVLFALWKSLKLASHTPIRALKTSPRPAFTDGIFLSGLAVTFLVMIASYSVVPFVSTSLVANGGVSETSLFSIYFFAGCASFFTSRYIGKLSDTFGKLRLFVMVSVLSIFTTLTITNLSKVGLVAAIIATSLFIVTNSGRVVPIFTLLTSAVSKESRGKFMSMNSAVQQLGSGLGAIFVGRLVYLRPNGHLEGFSNAGLLSVTSIAFAIAFASWIFAKRKTSMALN